MSAFTDGNGGHVSQLYGRSVYGYFHTLGVGGGTRYIVVINRGGDDYAVCGIGFRVNADACVIAVFDGSIAGTPTIREFAVGAVSNGADSQRGALSAFTDGNGFDVAERNRRSVHGNGNALGGRGGARYIVVINRGGDYHAVSGSGFWIDIDTCAVAVVDGLFASAPYIREVAVGAVGNGADGESGALSTFTDGNGFDVAKSNCRSIHGHFHALAGGYGAGLIAFTHRGRGHYAVFSSFVGVHGDGAGRLLGVPYVGNSPFGAGSSADGKLGLTTVADGADARDVIQHNGRSIHFHSESLGVGSRAGCIAFS